MAMKVELIDELLKGCMTQEDIFGEDGVFKRLVKAISERALHGKDKVKVICIDLSSSYRHLIQRYFPNAKIVADHFHVVRLMLHQCMQTY
jgi:transposase